MHAQNTQSPSLLFTHFRVQRGLAFGIIIVTALLAFEIFNYSTTDYALGDLLGKLDFMGVPWSTILSIAFCGIDFAGIARLFTPEDGTDEPGEVWYLFGAWLLAATMNAMLTWWGVSLAVLNHDTLGNAVIERAVLLRMVPIFVAVLVWLIRVLIIGTFSVAGERLFSQAEHRPVAYEQRERSLPQSTAPARSLGGRPSLPRPAVAADAFRPAPKTLNQPEAAYSRPEPTYHPLSAAPANSTSRSSDGNAPYHNNGAYNNRSARH